MYTTSLAVCLIWLIIDLDIFSLSSLEVKNLNSIKNSIKAKKRIWIYPYVKENDRGIKVKERMIKIYNSLRVPGIGQFDSNDIIIDISTGKTGTLDFKPIIDKIKSIINEV